MRHEGIMKKITNVQKFKIIYLLVYFGDSIFGNFLALYLVHLNYTPYEKGIILALVPIACFLGNFFYSYFGNEYRRNIILLKILSLIELLSVFFFGYISNIYLIGLLTFSFSFNNSSYFQIEEGTMSQTIKKYKTIYATVRVFGSIGYLCGLFFSSLALNFIDYRVLFMISGAFFLMTSIMLYTLDPTDYLVENFDSSLKNNNIEHSKNKTMLLKNKFFYLYLIYYVFMWGGTTLNWNIYPLYLNTLGLTDSQFGLFQALTVVFETIFMYLNILIFRKLKNNYKVFMIIACLLKIIVIIFEVLIVDKYTLAILCMVFNGIGSAFFIFCNVNFVNLVFGEKDLTRVLQLVVGVNNLFVASGNLLAPSIYTNTSFSVFFIIVGIFEIIGFTSMLFIKVPPIFNNDSQNI